MVDDCLTKHTDITLHFCYIMTETHVALRSGILLRYSIGLYVLLAVVKLDTPAYGIDLINYDLCRSLIPHGTTRTHSFVSV